MSLSIDVDEVTAVLLADGWHTVVDESFTLDAYEFHWQGQLLVGGGTVQGVPSTGFEFHGPDGQVWVGPLTSVLAIRRKPRS